MSEFKFRVVPWPNFRVHPWLAFSVHPWPKFRSRQVGGHRHTRI